MILSKESLVFVIAKSIIAAIFFVCGVICLSTNTCSVSRSIDTGFVGAGLGILWNACIIACVYESSKKIPSDQLKSKTMRFFVIKYIIDSIIIILGGGLSCKYIIGSGILGCGIGMICSTTVSLILMFLAMIGLISH